MPLNFTFWVCISSLSLLEDAVSWQKVTHAQLSREVAVIQQNSRRGMEQGAKAEPIPAAAEPVKRIQSVLGRAGAACASRGVHLV